MQTSFGSDTDLAGIRVHYNSPEARYLGAESFAQGSHIHFAGSPSHEIIGHELAHVVQQRQGRNAAGLVQL